MRFVQPTVLPLLPGSQQTMKLPQIAGVPRAAAGASEAPTMDQHCLMMLLTEVITRRALGGQVWVRTAKAAASSYELHMAVHMKAIFLALEDLMAGECPLMVWQVPVGPRILNQSGLRFSGEPYRKGKRK